MEKEQENKFPFLDVLITRKARLQVISVSDAHLHLNFNSP